jgi:hypothetical protein
VTIGDSFTYEPTVTKIEPSSGPATGGTSVTVHGEAFEGHYENGAGEMPPFVSAVKFGSTNATSHTVESQSAIKAVSPAGSGTVDVRVETLGGISPTSSADQFTYSSPIETTEYKNWVLSGSITDKKQGQAITLPEGSTFNGHGEVNAETGAGSVTGNISVPPFNTTLDLFEVLPVTFGLTVSPSAPVEGSVAKSETVPGDETLTIPLKLGIGVTSLSVMGLSIPTSCTTSQGASLALADNLTREELLSKGWSFSGATTLPRFHCEGPFGGIVGVVLTLALSGPENPFSLRFAP